MGVGKTKWLQAVVTKGVLCRKHRVGTWDISTANHIICSSDYLVYLVNCKIKR